MSRNHARLDWHLWARGRWQAFERGQHVAPGVERDLVAQALDWMREGDTLVVWRLDRLGRSLPQLVATVRRLEEKGFGLRSLRSLTEAMLRDIRGYPFVSDVIRSLPLGRTAFYHHFPKERIRELRG